MKINIKKAQAKQKLEYIDDGLNYGINIAIVALNQDFGFGKERSRKFVNSFLRLVNEIKGGAERFTNDYRYNIEYGFEKICKEALKITDYYDPFCDKKEQEVSK